MCDYREAMVCLKDGGAATYYAQRHSVEKTAELAGKVGQLGQLYVRADPDYDEVQAINGVRSMDVNKNVPNPWPLAVAKFEAFNPTHLVLTTPWVVAARWALRRGVEVLPIFADSFSINKKNLSVIRVLARVFRLQLRLVKTIELVESDRINANSLMQSFSTTWRPHDRC